MSTGLRKWDQILAESPLPALDGPDATAELLVVIAHRCIDWDIWGGARALRYWDALTDRVRTCCYAGPTLADWWDAMCRRMSLHPPRTAAERVALAAALSEGDDRAILDALSRHAEALVLRCRVHLEADKTRRAEEELADVP